MFGKKMKTRFTEGLLEDLELEQCRITDEKRSHRRGPAESRSSELQLQKNGADGAVYQQESWAGKTSFAGQERLVLKKGDKNNRVYVRSHAGWMLADSELRQVGTNAQELQEFLFESLCILGARTRLDTPTSRKEGNWRYGYWTVKNDAQTGIVIFLETVRFRDNLVWQTYYMVNGVH
jgi:hypothetical protein